MRGRTTTTVARAAKSEVRHCARRHNEQLLLTMLAAIGGPQAGRYDVIAP